MKKPINNTVRKTLIFVSLPLVLLSTNVQAHNSVEWILPSYFWIENSYHLHDRHHHHRHHRPRHVHNHHFKPYKKHHSRGHGHHDRRHHGQFHHRTDKRIIKKHSR